MTDRQIDSQTDSQIARAVYKACEVRPTLARLTNILEEHSASWRLSRDVAEYRLHALEVGNVRRVDGRLETTEKWVDVTEWTVRQMYEWLGY